MYVISASWLVPILCFSQPGAEELFGDDDEGHRAGPEEGLFRGRTTLARRALRLRSRARGGRASPGRMQERLGLRWTLLLGSGGIGRPASGCCD